MKLLVFTLIFGLIFTSCDVCGNVIEKLEDSSSNWWKSANFYQIYPRSFKDANNDGVGDLRGIVQKLPYLKETGVTAIWLSSIFESPQVDYGYDISNYTKVDPIFGTNAELEELFREAKLLGIKVIMDFVPNHTSDQHDWFKKSVAKERGFENFYVWHDGIPNGTSRPLPPNNWQSVFSQKAWTWNEQRESYYLHQFAPEQPDLNYREPRVVQAMKEVLTFWLDQGVDGFRVAAVSHLFEDSAMRDEPLSNKTDDPNEYGYTQHIYTRDLPETYEMIGELRQFIDTYNTEKGGDTRILFTEAYASVDNTAKYYADEEGKPRAHFPLNFVLIENLNEDSNAYLFKNEIDVWLTQLPSGAVSSWVLGNHDKPRFGSRYGTERIDGLLTLLLTLPGAAVTYNGDEIGMLDHREISWDETKDLQACNTNDVENYKMASRDPQRTPFQWDGTAYAGFKEAMGSEPWIEVNPNYPTLNLALQKSVTKSFYKFYQQLAELRKDEIFVNGNFESRAFSQQVFGYKRTLGDSSYVVLINLGNTSEIVDVNEISAGFPLLTEVVLAGSLSYYGVGYYVKTSEFLLNPYDTVVLKTGPADAVTDAPTTTISADSSSAAPTLESTVSIPTTSESTSSVPTAPTVPTVVPGPTTTTKTDPSDEPTTSQQTTESTTLGGSSLIASSVLIISTFVLYRLL